MENRSITKMPYIEKNSLVVIECFMSGSTLERWCGVVSLWQLICWVTACQESLQNFHFKFILLEVWWCHIQVFFFLSFLLIDIFFGFNTFKLEFYLLSMLYFRSDDVWSFGRFFSCLWLESSEPNFKLVINMQRFKWSNYL